MTAPRPIAHYTPRQHWMNDPNGLVYRDGRFHLFYQYNPRGIDWGNMSWGHATSPDLITWTERRVAIECTPEEAVFSGSVVVDRGATSGWGSPERPALVAIYTGVAPDGRQAQCLAVSLDDGATWTRHPDNPVLDRGSSAFRDPKVFWFAHPGSSDGHWVMVAVEAERRQVLIYRSADLRAWSPVGTVEAVGETEQLWECPDLFALDTGTRTVWVLVISVNPDEDGDGSATRYLVGDFDGETFVPTDPIWRRLDAGHDCYALVTFDSAPDGRRIGIGWMSNWAYAREVPTQPWRGVMTVPRELGARERDGEVVLLQRPLVADVPATADADGWRGVPGVGTRATIATASAFRLDLDLALDADARLRWSLRAGDGSELRVELDGAGTLTVDRRHALGALITTDLTRTVTRLPLPLAVVGLTLVVDTTSIEVFALDGEVVVTDAVFPRGAWTSITMTAVAGAGRVLDARYRPLGAAR
ncbi:glycoside hydrolase family 32 protein [Galbitalea sp. SE-J8]|uniref:glycoside hydrolase family 32 protein n=1 Tax=Galbitalea sp. SE-J8 TaxID=3054952 RepID=UPI00259D0701|nr:glycoside hydrolase family 32 protein [Galbitalea sp. SE-J8]MDM4763675.1 glycoside hydrolase family 32 protein [Galbitalea sp. SE-J8]